MRCTDIFRASLNVLLYSAQFTKYALHYSCIYVPVLYMFYIYTHNMIYGFARYALLLNVNVYCTMQNVVHMHVTQPIYACIAYGMHIWCWRVRVYVCVFAYKIFRQPTVCGAFNIRYVHRFYLIAQYFRFSKGFSATLLFDL